MKNPTRLNPSNRKLEHLIIHVTKLEYLGDYRLRLSFDDGVVKDVDLGPALKDMGGVFTQVKEKKFFKQVKVDSEAGTIVWPNGADWAPDVLYQM